MRLLIYEGKAKVGAFVAQYVKEKISSFVPSPERPFYVLGLPTGGTPKPVYAALIAMFKAGELSFKNVMTFNMDEYVGLAEDHPESYHSFMKTHLFNHIDIDMANVHILDGNAADLDAECVQYEAAITAAGGIDLFLGGIGPDGHVAFNEPGSSLESKTRIKTLTYDTIVANARFFGGDLAKVPRSALTVGVGTVMAAKEVLIIITGHSKAYALHKCIEEGVNHMWTVSAIQRHPKALIVCDDEATQELKVKTVNYFKGLMSTTSSFGEGKQTAEVRRASSARREAAAKPALNPPVPAVMPATPEGAVEDRVGELEAALAALTPQVAALMPASPTRQ